MLLAKYARPHTSFGLRLAGIVEYLQARTCPLCHRELETKLHYICHCSAYYEIRGRFHYFFREGFGPFSRVMRYEDQRCLGLFLIELCRHRESLMRGETNHSQSQRQITNFFRAHIGQSAPQQTLPHTRGILMDRAIALGRSRRPQLQRITQH